MKRTLLAVGIAVLVSMMFAPHYAGQYILNWYGPFFLTKENDIVVWDSFVLQTIFLAIAAASFLFGWLPQWGASVWSLFSSQALVPYVIEKIPALEKISVGFNWNFVTMPIGFGGAILLIWLLVRPARLDRYDAGDVIETNQHGGDFREP
jgi:hypothetical protein